MMRQFNLAVVALLWAHPLPVQGALPSGTEEETKRVPFGVREASSPVVFAKKDTFSRARRGGKVSRRKVAKASRPSKRSSQIYNTREPIDMQQVYRSSKKRRAKKNFIYSKYCGRYNRMGHTASICVMESGRIFGGIPPNIDENDRIVVYLITRNWLAPFYRLRIAPKTQVTVLENNEVIPEKELKIPAKSFFVVNKFVFGPFRGGEVVLAVSRPSIKRQGLGRVWVNYLLPINSLSKFNVGIGLIGIYPPVSTFKLLRERGSSVERIARTQEGEIGLDVILVAKFYSWQVWDPFLFAGRDVRKPPTFLQRFSLDIGFSFQNFLTSFYLGLSFEINAGLDLTVGANFRLEEVLAGGYKVGQPFSGFVEEIPRVKEVRPAFFFGLTITPEILGEIISQVTKTRTQLK